MFRPHKFVLNPDQHVGGVQQADKSQTEPLAEGQFDGFLEAAPDAVVIADHDGRIIRFNAEAERMFGYSREEVFGRTIELLIPERFRDRHVEQRAGYFANPTTRPMGTGRNLYGRRKNGDEFPAEVSLSPLPSEEGFVIASAIRDVTEQRRIEDELRRRTRELEDAANHKDEFLGMLAHELRNPLGTIRNAVQVLKQLGSPDSRLLWARDVIGRQADHMANLVADLLDASRIAQGKVRIQKEPVALDEIVDQAVETCRPTLNARKQHLTVSLPDQPALLSADPTRLVQVFTNLLNNAAKFTEVGGRISLTAEEEDREVVVRVRDDGIGIDAEMLPRIFDMFSQVPDAMDRSNGGLGIGLAIVGHMVQMHEGTVQAFSEGPGRGSEFVVRLPLLANGCAGIVGTRKVDVRPAEPAPRRILVVDDNEDLVEGLAQLLRRRGHDVQVAVDGAAALATALRFRPELIFLDIELPTLSGYEVARRLRRESGLENVVLVATTGHAEEEIECHARDAGFNSCLAKPFRLDSVIKLLADGRPSSLIP